ncbi:hypothetical protein [Larkinella soli]|uniref:hypothetical protein n=1 Tax=Larkinella soli TaxID=1770527 RepID=UPI000FFB6F13|nr:hypothetical protein [Larkinella soli]
MKKQIAVFLLLGSLVLPLSAHEKAGRTFVSNPLLLNGLTLKAQTLSMYTRGKLEVVEGDPSRPQAVRVPFRAYLRRDGTMIRNARPDFNRGWVQIEIAEILANARIGDELVIEPVRPEDQPAKRVLRVKNFWFYFNFYLDPGPGC